MKTDILRDCLVPSRSRWTAATPRYGAPHTLAPLVPRRADSAVSSSGMCAGRRVRSRSSPVRGRDAVGSVERARSPSTSPPRVSPQARLHRDNTPHRVRVIDSGYFSSRPPTEPLRLVHYMSVAEPIAPAVLPTTKRATHARSGAPQQRYSADNRRVVLGMLRELVTQLPLRTASSPLALGKGPPTIQFDNDISESSLKKNREYEMCSSELPPISDGLDHRSVATQARGGARASEPAVDRDRPHSSICTSSMAIENVMKLRAKGSRPVSASIVNDAGPEWVGGVRALRDSHVRLVLRQLRHIHRLNRTLDAAAAATIVVAQVPTGNVIQ